MTRRTRSVRLGRRLVVGIAGASALAAGMAGVGASSAAAAKKFCTKGNLTVTVFNFSEIPFKAALKGFEKYCPTVKVTFAVQTTDPLYPTALQTEKLAGKLTDIIETYDSLSPTLEVDGLVQPLNKYLNAKDYYPASYWLKGMSQSYIPPAGAQPKNFVGKQFFTPIEADATVFYYNVKDLTAAGYTVSPSATTSVTTSGGTIGDNWTWTDAETVWKGLTKGTTYGVCERPDWQAQWNPFITAEGATAMSETAANLNGPAALAAFGLLIAPEQNGTAIPFSTLQKNGDQCDPSFTSGAAAMSVGVRGDLPGLITSGVGPASNIGILPIPEITGAKGTVRPTGGGSVAWGVSTQAKHSDCGAGLPALLLLARRLRRSGEDVRDRACRDQHRSRPEGRLGHAAEQPGKQRRVHDRRQHGPGDRAAGPGYRVLGLADQHPERDRGSARGHADQHGDGGTADADPSGLRGGVDPQAELAPSMRQ
jgi:ABC-type glycerol-3-phosphate transport system substrate-binding protein